MKIKEIEISLGMTVSPRQYESVRVDGRVVVELAEGDSPEVAFTTARVKLEEQIESQLANSIAKFK